MSYDKVLSMIGLAKRAGRITSGTPLCEKDIKSQKSQLIIIAKDMSETGKKPIIDACTNNKVKYIEYSDMSNLGNAVGSVGVRAVISINDKSFADAIYEKYSISK